MNEVTDTQKKKFDNAVRMDQPFSLNKELQPKP
jgi:hypothetical protein